MYNPTRGVQPYVWCATLRVVCNHTCGVQPYVWCATLHVVYNPTRGVHMGYSFQLTARVLLYAPSQRQGNIKNTTAMSELSYHGATSRSPTTDKYNEQQSELTLYATVVLGNLESELYNTCQDEFGENKTINWLIIWKDT